MSGRNSDFLTSFSDPFPETEYTDLQNILNDAGVQLVFTDNDSNILKQEQALVVRDLEKTFITSPDCIQTFINEFKQLCTNENLFKKALTQTVLKKSAIEVHQDSLFRLLLRVDCLQKDITTILLTEITNTASEETENTSWLRSLLAPLRYLPYIKDAQELSTNLINILEVATYASQLEILDSIPEIVPDSQYSTVAKELSKLLDDNDELCAAVIDCLNALDLEMEIRLHVRDTILSKICAGTSLNNFPILLEFLISNLKNQNLTETMMKIRNALDNFLMGNKSKEKESNLIVIFSRLQTFATTSVAVVEAWLNTISCIKSSTDHKAIDLLILFMIHSSIKFKRKIVESIFRKRVSSGLFKVGLIERLFQDYIPQQLMKNYFTSIIEMAAGLLTLNDSTSKNFTITLFVIIFQHNFTEITQRQEILDCLLVNTGITNKVGDILKIFTKLLEDIPKLQRHTSTLMGLLEKMDTFDLNDIRQVFEILCTLTCNSDGNPLKDEIHMIVRKQLSSSIKPIKCRGVVSAITMAKHLASRDEEVSISESSESMTIADLPQGSARDAGILLDLVSVSTSGSPQLIGLYYDQVANMLVVQPHLDPHFLLWLYETITNNFQEIYITESIPDDIDDLHFTMQFNLNTSNEMDTPIAVNIAKLTVQSQQITLLAPLFRLLRLLHYKQQNGDLSSIDAVLGCGVILPETSQVDDLEADQVKIVVDCLYHCANWFREIINGFVTQKNKKLRQRVVQRLDDLIKVESLLKNCLDLVPDHKLPACYFETTQKQNNPPSVDKTKNPKKKFKSTSVINETTTTKTRIVNRKSSTSEQVIQFRDLDPDLVILLKYPLKIGDNVETFTQQSTQSSGSSHITTLNVNQLMFLIKDFVSKLMMLTQEKPTNCLTHLNMMVPINLITDCAQILPTIDKHLNVIINQLEQLIPEDEDFYNEQATSFKECFGLILHCFYLIFSWSGFQHSTNMELLRKILRSLRAEQSQTLHSTNRLIAEFINRFSGYLKYCYHLSHAVHLVKIMQSLYNLTTPSTDIKKQITNTSSQLLSRRWYNFQGILDSGKLCNSNINDLVNVYLDGASIKVLSGLVGSLQREVGNLKGKNDHLEMLAAINKQNFHIFYQSICNSLQKRVKNEIQSITNNEHLIIWQNIALTMQGLMNIAKLQETKVNLSCYLKKSIAILKIFLSHGIPIMEIMLRSKPDEVCQIFRTLQISTRFSHHLCCFSKLTKDASLVAHVPQFRLTLETLVYRVKAALVANNCSAAFWMGILRNKDIHGEDILSQSTDTTVDNEEVENNDEQLPSDDESDINLDENQDSDSEVFD